MYPVPLDAAVSMILLRCLRDDVALRWVFLLELVVELSWPPTAWAACGW